MWDAKSERAAVVALMALVKEYGKDPLSGRPVWIVRSIFKEVTFHPEGMVGAWRGRAGWWSGYGGATSGDSGCCNAS